MLVRDFRLIGIFGVVLPPPSLIKKLNPFEVQQPHKRKEAVE